MTQQTLLVGLAHPDDEVGAAGTILAQKARGDRVVVVWLTQGEMTAAFGNIPAREVARRRTEDGREVGRILGVETRFLDFPDTRVAATPDSFYRVARLIAEIQPAGVLTWGNAWIRGMRHPDHQACGEIFRSAIVLARIAGVVQPLEPHRLPTPVFTYRDAHSQLPAVAVDVEPFLDQILELASVYYRSLRFGDPGWIRGRLETAGKEWGLRYAEVFDAWETRPGRFATLLPAEYDGPPPHPTRNG